MEISKFSNEAIQRAIDDALATIPEGQNGAVVGYVDGEHAKLAVAGRLGDQWSIVGVLDKPWHSPDIGVEAQVRFTW